MEQKKKLCSVCNEMTYLWKSQPPKCKPCSFKNSPQIGNYKLSTKSVSSDIKPVEKKKSYKIPNVSEKQKERLKRYRILRDAYMKEHKYCEAQLSGCTILSSCIHHRKGRQNDNLFSFFLAVCNKCHDKIEVARGQWVYEQGFKIKRTED